jgi:NAD dependent epimerase/dehydratase family enzyme
MPAFAARLAFGELADELLLASQRVVPKRLQEDGFAFTSSNLKEALAHLLNSPPSR